MRVEIKRDDLDNLILTPKKYNRGERYVGTAILSQVTIKDNVCTGVLVGEYLEEFPFSVCELPKGVKDKMKPVTQGVTSAKVVYATGREMFYLSQ